ncbi:MAG: crossover junction endodeoxyribonuclease RuvC [Salana multivorans]|uniref:crossover junction endodeoxyribonuclease RuvC n=1 Tax=Salana multivorans TaxID=120377 RepID=UPI00095B5E15|nr:crossover junction endodeoxyribonuclease RuvC [Salana multivorans]MBN8883469.1 crossover junction endodeoxyribonuclease RuvC [Salana multivorans]OJX98659.1 MAG: hypothetical protein BGO96_04585 [Micrococcales bacterium 73-15]
MNTVPPRIVGIDPSLTSTGVAVIDRTTGIQLHRVQSKGRKTATLPERDHRLADLANRIYTHVTGADLVVIESPAYSNSLGSMHDRSGLWWLLVRHLHADHVPVLEVPPTVRAKYATGRGNAGKDEVLAAVIRRYPHTNVTGNDVADALTLAAIGARLTGWPLEPTLPQTSLTALTKLHHPNEHQPNVPAGVRVRKAAS